MVSSDPLGRASFLLASASIRPADSSSVPRLGVTAVKSLLGLILPILGLPKVTERGEELDLGLAPLVVHGGGITEYIWGLGGLDIGVVDS